MCKLVRIGTIQLMVWWHCNAMMDAYIFRINNIVLQRALRRKFYPFFPPPCGFFGGFHGKRSSSRDVGTFRLFGSRVFVTRNVYLCAFRALLTLRFTFGSFTTLLVFGYDSNLCPAPPNPPPQPYCSNWIWKIMRDVPRSFLFARMPATRIKRLQKYLVPISRTPLTTQFDRMQKRCYFNGEKLRSIRYR